MLFNFNNSYETLPDRFYRKVEPTPVDNPSFYLSNKKLAEELGIDPDMLFSDDGLAILSGNSFPEEASSIAMAYRGHQFGYPTMLGDGRAILVGEQITPTGVRYDIQLKGSGRTPFSRGGDGRASLGPMIREYLMSEAMHALGVPTTRALAVARTGQSVYRNREEDGAILTRVAESHLRIGTFEWAETLGEVETLLDYAIKRHDPDLAGKEDRALLFFKRVAIRQAKLIATWMALGFIHGVMNTDNMTISGETIDYGPCAFMDTFDPKTVYSSIDTFGRYRFENQGQIGVYNLSILGDALLPLLSDDPDEAESKKASVLARYADVFEAYYFRLIGRKLGFDTLAAKDVGFVTDFLSLMYREKLDYTESFLRLTYGDRREDWSEEFKAFYDALIETTKDGGEELRYRSNPAIIPRNYLVERAIREAEAGDSAFLFELLDLLKDPFAHREEQKALRITPAIPLYKTYCGT